MSAPTALASFCAVFSVTPLAEKYATSFFIVISSLFAAEYRKIAVFTVIFEFHCAESFHIRIGNDKIKFAVFLYMLARGSFRQGDKPKLKNIPYAELCGRYAVFLRRFGNSGAFQRLTVRDGRICLYGNAVKI